MEKKNKLARILGLLFIFTVLTVFLAPDIADARRGGRSFGGSRSFRKSTPLNKAPRKTTPRMKTDPKKTPSFGGSRITSSQARQKYGTPRKTQTMTGKNAAGQNQQYVVHSYGGYGSGLMTGYLMGSTSWLWFTPFHPAFYYSRPQYVTNEDGTMEVYPPTFSFQKVFFIFLIIGTAIFLIVRYVKNKKLRENKGSGSSFV
ncbi:MAG: hypothetical protein ACLFQU_11605 [Candidatus Kapaibacterium sp.]